MKQKGFTLIELLVVLAIGGVITWGIVVSIHQVVWGTGRTNSQVVALTNVHQAALRLKKDLVMTQLGKGDFPADGTTWVDYNIEDPQTLQKLTVPYPGRGASRFLRYAPSRLRG